MTINFILLRKYKGENAILETLRQVGYEEELKSYVQTV